MISKITLLNPIKKNPHLLKLDYFVSFCVDSLISFRSLLQVRRHQPKVVAVKRILFNDVTAWPGRDLKQDQNFLNTTAFERLGPRWMVS